jgi:hypothetical protein
MVGAVSQAQFPLGIRSSGPVSLEQGAVRRIRRTSRAQK